MLVLKFVGQLVFNGWSNENDVQVYHRTMLNDVSKTGAKVRPQPPETNVMMDQLKLQIDRVRLFLNSSLVKTLGALVVSLTIP
jgi:hypothetical protein